MKRRKQKAGSAVLLAFAFSALFSSGVFATDLEVQIIGGAGAQEETGKTASDDLEIQIIGSGSGVSAGTSSVEDMKIGESYVLDGYARVEPVSFCLKDSYVSYEAGFAGNNEYGESQDETFLSYDGTTNRFSHILWEKSGQGAEYVWLQVDLGNLQKDPVNFLENVEVKVIYDEEYELEGWACQLNADYTVTRPLYSGTAVQAAVQQQDAVSVDMLYTGHYVFGCKVPNLALEGDKSLRMEITIDGNLLEFDLAANLPQQTIPKDAVYFAGHYYAAFSGFETWEEAQEYCASLGGHLATISSRDENRWLFTQFYDLYQAAYEENYERSNFFCGLSDSLKEGAWRWCNDELIDYMHWSSGEPDNSGDQDYMTLFYDTQNAAWDDCAYHGSEASWFLCEWD